MFGLGIAKGLAVTLKHFVATYVDDLKCFPRRYSQEALADRQRPEGQGLFTVEYPEQELAVPEAFRFIPFLVYDEDKESADEGLRCTSCGICAKVCPPQCIWIVRGEDPVTKRPVPEPEAFFIDIDICMNCGFCAEFCPFDAIKMDHDYELADYERHVSHIYDYNKLMKSTTYYQSIRPSDYEYEEANLTRERQAAKAKKMAAAAAASASAEEKPV
jgi:NADH-quinone oxidoreductase subunit I